MTKKLILNGWIAPDGEIFECGRMGHRKLAYEIADKKGFFVDIEPYCDMWGQGYIRFSGNTYCDEPTIEFDLENRFDYDGNPIEITEAQKMAQGRLMKQFYKKGGSDECCISATHI